MRSLRLFLYASALLLALGRFSTAQLPVTDGLQLWLDAGDASTIFQTSPFEDPASFGDFVESWKDKSPNEYEASIFSSDGLSEAGPPVYEENGINGLPSIRFSGAFADGLFIEDAFELQRPYTAFIANQYYGDIRGRTLQSQDINWLVGLWNGNLGHYAEGWVTPQPAADVNRPYVADAIGTETESFFHINGVADWTTNSSPVGQPGRLAIAGAGMFPAEVSDADVSEIIIYDRVLSDDELTSVRNHLYTKYGTTPHDPPPPAELIVHQGAVGTFQSVVDLDFSGDFVHAVNVGGPAENSFGDPLTIGDAAFLDGTNAAEPDLNDVGVTMTVVNEILNWHDPDYGADTEDDENLAFAMQSIRWNVPPGVAVDLAVEEGESYKLQMLFAESCCDRGFDIFVEDAEVVEDLVVQQQQGGINVQDTGVSYTLELVAGDDELNILLGGSVAVPDNNPILNAFTLEKIEAIGPVCDPNTMGDLDGNGKVEFADFLVLAENFGAEGVLHTGGDIDCNGKVEFSDFLVLAENFGSSTGEASSVPEPAGFALLIVGACSLGLLRRRRR